MVNDPRRDHKFVIPRPDIAGIPNACINCHSDKKWVLEKFTKLWPKLKTQDDYEITFIKAMKGTPGIGKDILFLIKNSLVPSIIRASSVKLTANYPLIMNQALEFALKDSDSLINLAALEMVPNSAQYTESIKKLLQSPHRLIRSQAAFILNKDLGEYLDSLNFNIDDYSSLINLGNLNVANKEFDLAHKNFDQAIKINPHNIPAYVNKADLYRAQGQDDRAEKVLKKGLSIINSGETHMALGLLYVRKKDSEKALNHFEKSYKANSDNFRSLYMYALALDSYGNPNKALKLLESNYEKFSEQPTYHQLLIGICKKSGLSKKVDRYYAKFEEIVKNNR
jgi:tetratricopeptide (TPR) repeat protein